MAECEEDRAEANKEDPDSQVIFQKLKDAARAAERGGGTARGKRPTSRPSASRPDDDDDCQVIEVLDVMPYNYALPYTISDTPASAGESAAADKGKKRAAEEPAAETKKKKLKKTAARKGSSTAYAPPRPKPRAVGTG